MIKDPARIGESRPKRTWASTLVGLLIIGATGYFAYKHYLEPVPRLTEAAKAVQSARVQSDDVLARAFVQQLSNVQVQGGGVVERILADDSDGSRHQRFIVRVSSSQTVLIAHNVDLAPRIASLREGDQVQFSGEYEWNDKGGVVHWTHRDPKGNHEAGWIKHNGQTYQ